MTIADAAAVVLLGVFSAAAIGVAVYAAARR